ncbi:MAG: glycosyltransferase [Sphingomonadales bacterium]|nr:glycosyltransferase [Sphingomonadales bacterium]
MAEVLQDPWVWAAATSLAAWVYLYFFHGGFWRGDQRLGDGPAELGAWPRVTAVVPARDEEATIGRCLAALVAQDYAGPLTVILADDSSSDGTAAEAARVAAAAPPGRPVETVTAPPLEPGWTGKLWALNAGLDAAATAAPDYLWFTDADIIHEPEVLTSLVAKAEEDNRALVSLMVRLNCETFWERLLIPAFVFFFQKLYPFPRVNDPGSEVAGAAGGCVLLRRAALASAGGLAAIRSEIIDDCALARLIKGARHAIWLGLADHSRSLRRYEGLADIWSMVARTAFTQLNHSYLAVLGAVLGMVLVYLVPPAAVLGFVFHQNLLADGLGAVAWLLMAAAYLPTIRDFARPPLEAVALPIAAFFYGAMTAGSALDHLRGKGGRWKQRSYDFRS